MFPPLFTAVNVLFCSTWESFQTTVLKICDALQMWCSVFSFFFFFPVTHCLLQKAESIDFSHPVHEKWQVDVHVCWSADVFLLSCNILNKTGHLLIVQIPSITIILTMRIYTHTHLYFPCDPFEIKTERLVSVLLVRDHYWVGWGGGGAYYLYALGRRQFHYNQL